MKKCSKCGEDKPNSEFHNNKYSIDGLTSSCKECNNKKAKERRNSLENLERKFGPSKLLCELYKKWKESNYKKGLKPCLINGVLSVSEKKYLKVIGICSLTGEKREYDNVNQAYVATGVSPSFIKWACKNGGFEHKNKKIFFQFK